MLLVCIESAIKLQATELFILTISTSVLCLYAGSDSGAGWVDEM